MKNRDDAIAVADFLARLSHDLRSPLGVVEQVLAEINADFDSSLTDQHRQLLGLADRGILRLRRLSETVSLAGALESGGFELRRGAADLTEILRSASEAAAAVETRREVQISYDLPAGPCPMSADADRLGRAFAEIVINAIRHARGKVRVSLAVADGEARAAVEDDGQGVAEDRRDALFQRFVLRPTRSGLGVGLSIAHDIIVAHGGRLSVEASTLPPGRRETIGASFVAVLPVGSK